MNATVLAASILALIAFTAAANAAQARIGSRVGTDHAAHAFLVRAIRHNGGRLFTRIPGLLNRPACGANPLYVHWMLAHLPLTAFNWARWLLNPVANVLHLVLFAVVAVAASRAAGLPIEFALLASALFAFTPQSYHALSARNFGISSRGIGLLLLTGFFSGLVATVVAPELTALGYIAMVACSFLIFAVNTFAMQALIATAVLLAVLFLRFAPLAGAAGGLALFVAAHPRYSAAYLINTARFIRSYAKELAPVYILSRRYSIWRDLVWDIWLKIAGGPIQGLRYAYENSLLVVVLLNPLVILACARRFDSSYGASPALDVATQIAISGTLAMLLTTFRATRFLGEPERYVEAVAPWGALAGGAALVSWAGMPAGWAVCGLFVLAMIAQIAGSLALVRHIQAKPIRIDEAAQAIRRRLGDDVRLCSNNEQLTKLFLANDWEFSYCIAVGEPYCGMTMAEAFSEFPYLRREALGKIVTTFGINAIVFDRNAYDLAALPELRGAEIVYQSAGLMVVVTGPPGER